MKPVIRVVMRLFDDDLVAKVSASFEAQAFSTSALAGPALAMAALDPSIKNSFEVGSRLMVVAELVVSPPLAGRTVAQLRDENSALVLHLVKKDGQTVFDPPGAVALEAGDRATLQSTLEAYRGLREKLLAA